MKKIYTISNIFLLLCTAFASFSCNNEDIDSYNTETSYIYFDVPYIMNSDGTASNFREDSISYSFALDPEDVTSTTLKVVVKTIGTARDYDRPYNVEVINETTTATSSEWDPNVINNRSIKAGELTDTIRIDVQRTQALEDEWKQVYLRIIPNEDFALGYGNLEEVKVSFSDILARPDWWSSWEYYFGEYHPEVYRKWIELYPLGADPMVHYENGEPLYWDNMLPYPDFYNYPVVQMYYQQLKQYFDNNDVYPDGDTSRDPIRLPNV